MASGKFGDALHEFALFGIGVAHGDKLAAAFVGRVGTGCVAAAHVGNAAGGLDMLRGEEGFDGFEVGVVGDGSAAIALDVDLVDFDLAGELVPGLLEVGGILHLLDNEDGDVDSDAELVVIGRGRGLKRAVGSEAEYRNSEQTEQARATEHGMTPCGRKPFVGICGARPMRSQYSSCGVVG